MWTLLRRATIKTASARQAGFAATKAEAANAKNIMTSKAIRTYNQWQLRPLVCMAGPQPLLNGLAKKLVDVSGDPRECQWLHQRLSLAVVRGNAASILACVQV